MCVVSMVHDGYEDKFPWVAPEPSRTMPWNGQWPPPVSKPEPVDLSKLGTAFDLAALIKEFRELIEAAKLIDLKTGQPDCVDPEKAKLSDRVAELEKLLASPPEFVIVSGGNVEPGRYRVIDGKLYRAVE